MLLVHVRGVVRQHIGSAARACVAAGRRSDQASSPIFHVSVLL